MITTIPRGKIRIDSAADLAVYIDSSDDERTPIPDYYRPLLEVVRRSPKTGKALESIRTLIALLRRAESNDYNTIERCVATIRAGHSFTDGKLWFLLAQKERAALLASSLVRRTAAEEWYGAEPHPLPVAELRQYMRTDGSPLSIDPDGSPLKGYCDPTLVLRAEVGRSIRVRADLFGFLLRRYPGANWYAGRTNSDPIVFGAPGAVVALLMPIGVTK